jgi:excisionase family DNA binding protein
MSTVQELPYPTAAYDGYVDKRTLARFLDVSPRTIETWTRRKKIPYVKFGVKSVRYRLADIEKAIRKNHLVKEVSLER